MNVHQLILCGRATKDGEELESKAKKKYAKFTIAVNEYKTASKEEKAYYYDVVVFGKSAENVAKNVKKGDVVMAIGKPEVDAYISKRDNEAKGSISVLADSWKVLK